MAQTHDGAMKLLAKQRGMTVEELREKLKTHSYCNACEQWLLIDHFGVDRSRFNGLHRKCSACRSIADPSKSRKGQPSTFKGRKHSDESRKKMSVARIGNTNRLGKPFTPEQRLKISDAVRAAGVKGERSPRWKGGVTSENETVRASIEYAEWRKAVFERDLYTCQQCGDKRGGNLNAHHIKPFAGYPDLRLDVSNGITLCEKCHTTIHLSRVLTNEEIYLIEIAYKYALDMFGSLRKLAAAFGVSTRIVRKIVNQEGMFSENE